MTKYVFVTGGVVSSLGKGLASAALGHNQLFEILATGRCTVDLLIYMKANYKLSRYTLNAVATQFVGDQKEDIAHADIYRYFDGTPEERRRYTMLLTAYM